MALGTYLSLFIGNTVPLPAPPSLVDALQSVEVTNSDNGRDGFQITFSVGRSGPSDRVDYPLMSNPLLKSFSRVVIMVNAGSVPQILIDGIITHIQLTPSYEPGQSTLTVTGEDVSIMMDMEEKSETYPNMPDPIIVANIIASYATYGFVPMIIPPPSLDVPISIDMIPTQQDTDLSYVLYLASRHNYVFYVEPVTLGVNRAYWGPLNLTSFPQKALSVNMGPETNVSSINFQYNALTPHMVKGSVHDRLTNQIMPVQTIASMRPPPPLSSQPAWMVNKPNVRVEQFRDTGLSVIEAFDKAQADTDRSMDVLVANGEVDSLMYGNILQARNLVGLRGAGYAHDGLYYVKSVTHRIKPGDNVAPGDYTQAFTLTREGFGTTTPVVPP